MKRIEVRAFENGRPIESAVAHSWAAFLNGKWTRARPTKPGKYLIANRDGRVVGEVFVFFDAELGGLAVRIRDSALCKLAEMRDGTAAWWWSIPMPLLMPIAVPKAVGGRPALSQKTGAGDPADVKARASRFEAERRRALRAQVGLHEMPRSKDES